ncbi:MAG: hypothetical protein KGY80_11425 [Candidatus Thorarchaeota archaeon]|nr:hypothetical protein [Candidatus Thorarchaeota archaeon]
MSARTALRAIFGSGKLLAKTGLAVWRAKRRVKKGKNVLRKKLEVFGMPSEAATEVAEAYGKSAEEALSVRNMISMARNME